MKYTVMFICPKPSSVCILTLCIIRTVAADASEQILCALGLSLHALIQTVHTDDRALFAVRDRS